MLMLTVTGISTKTYEEVKKEIGVGHSCMHAVPDPCVRRYSGVYDRYGRCNKYRNGRAGQH